MDERTTLLTLGLLLMLWLTASSCEVDTKLTVNATNPPEFTVTGNGDLMTFEISGPEEQRRIQGPDSNIYWKIQSNERPGTVGNISSIIYGKVPEGYAQVYPERGEAPPLMEGVEYRVWVNTKNANGFRAQFTIKDGKVDLYKY